MPPISRKLTTCSSIEKFIEIIFIVKLSIRSILSISTLLLLLPGRELSTELAVLPDGCTVPEEHERDHAQDN